jgi:hypothetical protein
MLCLIIVTRPGGASRGSSGTLGREERVECCGYYEVFMWYPSSMSVKDHTVLALMANLELCTDRMSCFMGPISRVAFVTTMSNHTSLLCVMRLLLEGE